MKKLWLIPVFALWIALGVWFVNDQNERYRAQEAINEAHQSDIRLCRINLGIDYDFGQRGLIMACVHEVTLKADNHGGNRREIFNKAWKACMPEMDTCERALR